MSNLLTSCSCHGSTFENTTKDCGSIGAPCCREPNKNNPKKLCEDGPCACYNDGTFVYATDGCGSIGVPCCREPNKNNPRPFCKKPPPPPPPKPKPPPPPPKPVIPAPTPAPSVLYSCNNYQCKEDANGSYKTLSDCQNACKSEPYSCDQPTGHCYLDPKGKFKSLHDCNTKCSPKYNCHVNDDGTTDCVIAKDGKFSSLSDCQKNCQPKYMCHEDMMNQPTCRIAPKNSYGNTTCSCHGPTFENTTKDCGALGAPCCREPNKDNPKKLCEDGPCSCYKDGTFVYATDGCGSLGTPCCREPNKADPRPFCKNSQSSTFSSLGDCQSSCQAKYSCDPTTNICKMDDNGTYDLKSCQENCKPKFSCDTDNYVCAMDPLGKYSSSSECNDNCRPPLIIPKESITQSAFDEAIAETKTLKGSLNSSDNRFNSVSLQYIAYSLLVIFVLGLIYYYTTNKTDNLMGTIIAIFTAGLLIYIIGNYVSKHYSANTSSYMF